MNAMQEINGLVKKAQVGILNRLGYKKPIDYFDKKYQTAMNGPANPAAKPFDFQSEAIKLLKSYGANASRAGGAYSTDLGRQMSAQWRDIKQNQAKYDDARLRQILEQWKGNIAKMRSAQKPRPHSYAGTDTKGNAMYLNGQGRPVALSQLKSMQMAQKWNQPYMDTPANRARGFAGMNPIKPKQDAAPNPNQVALN